MAIAFVVAAAGSSFLVLRAAPVSPDAHPSELTAIRELVRGDEVLFLGRDDFIAWHLRGSAVSTHVQNFFSTGRVPARVDPPAGEKFDFDAVSAETLDRFDWALTARTAYASAPYDSFDLAVETPSYLLWERREASEPRGILDEGTAPGAVPDCEGPKGHIAGRGGRGADRSASPGWVGTWGEEPVEAGEGAWAPAAAASPGAPARQILEVGSEQREWELSLAYDSPRPLVLTVTSPAEGARSSDGDDRETWQERLVLPANLDFRGPTPPFAAGTITLPHGASEIEVEVSLKPAPVLGRLLGAEGEAHLRGLFAVPIGAPGAGPNDPEDACDAYVDWYRPAN